jgi:hypothetical protein
MAADKRNASVVFTLIGALTVGLAVLLWLESRLVPKRPNWQASTLLMAEQGLRVRDVEITYVPPPADENAVRALRAQVDPADSLCWISPDGDLAPFEVRGPHVRVVVLGSDRQKLDDKQKLTLLNALGTLSQQSGHELVPVQLSPESDTQADPNLPEQARDLRSFLVLKGFIPDRVE